MSERIRKRMTYVYWRKFAEFLLKNPTNAEILHYAHSLIDQIHGYGTRQLSDWSEESLNLVIKDMGIAVETEHPPHCICEACSAGHMEPTSWAERARKGLGVTGR